MGLEEVAQEIASMKIRGAGRIARAAASALRDVAISFDGSDVEDLAKQLRSAAEHLFETRPTAVSLGNAIRFVMQRLDEAQCSDKSDDLDNVRGAFVDACNHFIDRSKRAVEEIGRIGGRRIKDGNVIRETKGP